MPQTPTLISARVPNGGSPKSPAERRAFRVKLAGSILTLILLPNRRQLRAKLHQLSPTGGVLHIQTPLDEKVVVELIFQIGETPIREKSEMLFPMWATQGWLQPFRFNEMTEANRGALETALHSLVNQVGDSELATSIP
jgi:hypothetical protein